MRVLLVPLDGGEPIEVTRDIIVVGRRKSCDVRLKHQSVSKVHLVLVVTDGLLLFRDLGSTNGTKVNGRRVRGGALLPDDKLSIAARKFRVAIEASPSDRDEYKTEQAVAQDKVPEVPPVVRRVIPAKSPRRSRKTSKDGLEDKANASSKPGPAGPKDPSVEFPQLDSGSSDVVPLLDD